jgi:hypothetical protein
VPLSGFCCSSPALGQALQFSFSNLFNSGCILLVVTNGNHNVVGLKQLIAVVGFDQQEAGSTFRTDTSDFIFLPRPCRPPRFLAMVRKVSQNIRLEDDPATGLHCHRASVVGYEEHILYFFILQDAPDRLQCQTSRWTHLKKFSARTRS